MKNIAILGSTGSIGRQTLEVITACEDLNCTVLTAGQNFELLSEQIAEHRPKFAVMQSRQDVENLKDSLQNPQEVNFGWGKSGLKEAAAHPDVDLVVNALVGAVGLEPTLESVNRGRDVALANKETLVAGGELVIPAARENGANIFPVDSEHSAIWQCLRGEDPETVARLILTASGGPFRKLPPEKLETVTKSEALKHPNWSMGEKITIDSATLMNKGLEVIEAHWLFGIDYDNISVLIHPESIIHSMVEFVDGAIKAELGPPDMRCPIQLALTQPRRIAGIAERFDLSDFGRLNFEEVDEKKFPLLPLAYFAGRQGGTLPVVLNAANEVAVGAFLDETIGFRDIFRIVEEVVFGHTPRTITGLEDIYRADAMARRMAEKFAD